MNQWQCCYTNTEIDAKVGWQGVAISTGIPPRALEQCDKFQISHSKIDGNILDEEGKALNLYNIFTDEHYAYAIRSQYGVLDVRDRPSMFSCAFIVTIEDFIKNPNVLLGISKSDFPTNLKDAQSGLKKGIKPYQDINTKKALSILKMDKAVYKKLLHTIYTKSKDVSLIETTYITDVQNESQRQALLYLICKGLPNFIRKRLRISNADSINSEIYNLVLMRKNESGFDFHTGRGGDSSPSQSVIYEILDTYVDLALQKNADSYYKALESKASQLGDVMTNPEKAYKVAYSMLYQKKDIKSWKNQVLIGKLSDAILLNPAPILEDYLTEIIKEVVQRDMVLTTAMQDRIDAVSEVLHGGELRRIWRDYSLQQFEKLSQEEAMQKLKQQSNEQRMALCNDLWSRKNRQDWVKQYYRDVIQSSRSLDDLYEKIQEYLNLEFTSTSIDKEIPGMADELFVKICKEPGIAVSSVRNALDRKVEIYLEIDSPTDVMSLEKVSQNQYWEEMSVSDIPFEEFHMDAYRSMEVEGNEKSEFVIALLHDYQAILQDIPNIINSYEALEEIAQKIKDLKVSDVEKETVQERVFSVILNRLQEYEYECDLENGIVSLDTWLFLGKKLRKKGGTCFDIFNKMSDRPAMILERKDKGSIEQIITDSKLLKTSPYVHYFYRYIKGRGKYSKQLKKWKKYMDKEDKPAGLLGMLFGRFKKH